MPPPRTTTVNVPMVGHDHLLTRPRSNPASTSRVEPMAARGAISPSPGVPGRSLHHPICRRRHRAVQAGGLLSKAAENRREWAGLPAHLLTQPYMQLGPDRLPDAITLELAKDVVDRRARRKAVGADSARGSGCAADGEWRPSPPACRSCAAARRPLGISGSSRAHSASLRSFG
jgi:hypothetical protein